MNGIGIPRCFSLWLTTLYFYIFVFSHKTLYWGQRVETGYLCGFGCCPGISCSIPADLTLTEMPASASGMLVLRECVTDAQP